METSTPTAVYRTYDLPTAVTLNCYGHQAEVVRSEQPDRAEFVFPKTQQLEVDLTAFARGEAKVSPLAYENIKRHLLDQVHAVLRERGRRDG